MAPRLLTRRAVLSSPIRRLAWTAALAALAVSALPCVSLAQDDDLVIDVPSRPTPQQPTATPPATPTVSATPDDVAALRATVAALEARLEALEDRPVETPPARPATPDPDPAAPSEATRPSQEANPDVLGFLPSDGTRLTAYLQLQFDHSDLSQDQLAQGGASLNFDRFFVRRGRVRLDGRWELFAAAIEVDTSTTRGLSATVQRAEVTALWRNEDARLPPYLAVTGGLSDIPFGFELVDTSRRRVFMERTTAGLAFFRGSADAGVRVWGGYGPLRYALGLQNGSPIDDRAGTFENDLNQSKDLIARVGLDAGPDADFELAGGVSALVGTGFHPGTDATKGSLLWSDFNENGVVDNGELTGVPGRSASPSQNFGRWAFNADLRLGVRTPIGLTRFYGEVTIAQNLDRSLYIADPITIGTDLRHVAFYLAYTQQITDYVLLGIRYDYYNPNADYLDSRVGRFVPQNQSIQTVSPVVGVAYPGVGRLTFQYDFVFDTLARDRSGVPTDLRNDQFSVRAQVEL